jgi:hypothetical protein
MPQNFDRYFDESWSIEDTGTGRLRLTRGKLETGFDPYGGTVNQRAPRKKDLRKLGEWLEAKRRAEALKLENELDVPPAPAPEPTDKDT